MKFVLASASPRRQELLGQIGLEYTVQVSGVAEEAASEVPQELVCELSRQKAESVFRAERERRSDAFCVIGADTVVSVDGAILGKPEGEEDAKRMLRLLAGREHEVFTGVTLIVSALKTPVTRTFFERTAVRFAPMSEEEIGAYVATGDPMDKAGAYGIQGICARYIEGITGEYSNVVGLPVARLYRELRGLEIW